MGCVGPGPHRFVTAWAAHVFGPHRIFNSLNLRPELLSLIQCHAAKCLVCEYVAVICVGFFVRVKTLDVYKFNIYVILSIAKLILSIFWASFRAEISHKRKHLAKSELLFVYFIRVWISGRLQLHCKFRYSHKMLSVVVCRLSVTRVYCDRTAEARIMQFSQ